MDMLRRFLLAFLVLDLIIINAVVGYLFIQNQSGQQQELKPMISEELNVGQDEESVDVSCNDECTRIVDEKIAEMQSSSTEDTSNNDTDKDVEPEPTRTSASDSKDRTVSYVPIPGSGSTLSNDWVTLEGTDFFLSKDDYTGLKEAYFEANMYLKNGNGKAYLRIFDVTHGVGVDGSQIETSNQNSTFVSSDNINLWGGYNHYVVQARSLTADTTHYQSGRLKIIQEN